MHPTLYWAYDYLYMLVLNLTHDSKRDLEINNRVKAIPHFAWNLTGTFEMEVITNNMVTTS